MEHSRRMSDVAAEIGLCLLLSAADGEISDEELGALTSRIGELLGDDFAPARLSALVDGELSRIADAGADGYVASLVDRIPAARRQEAMEAACSIACADGLSPEEEEMLRLAGKALDVDVDAVLERGSRFDTDPVPASAESHDDPPDETTALVAARLLGSGWSDPMAQLRAAGIHVEGFGALALQYESPTKHVLRVEHHTCDGSVHFHVTDELDVGADFVLYAVAGIDPLIDALVAMQERVTLDTLEDEMRAVMDVARVCAIRDGERVELTRS